MGSSGIVPDESLHQEMIEPIYVMGKLVHMVISKFFLDSAVEPLNLGILGGPSGIVEEMDYILLVKLVVKPVQKLAAVVSLDMLDCKGAHRFQLPEEIPRSDAGVAFVRIGESKS